MPLDQLTPQLPIIAIAAGVVLLLWGQRDRLKALLGAFKPVATTETPLSPTDRFETFYAIRAWCEGAGHTAAVKALDSQVLPTIVRRSTEGEGGPKP